MLDDVVLFAVAHDRYTSPATSLIPRAVDFFEAPLATAPEAGHWSETVFFH
jgi:hypothetical protein